MARNFQVFGMSPSAWMFLSLYLINQLWCSNSIFLSHTDESSKDETRVCGCISTTYHVAGMHRWSGHLNEFGGQDLALQWKSSSSELSPQSLSPSQSQYGSTQIVVFLHCIWPSGQVTFWSAQVTLDSSEVLLSLQSLMPLHFWLSGIHL